MIYQEIAQIIQDQITAALCVVVKTKGSTPRLAGSKMLVFADGHISGTIGGGEMEHRVVQEALAALQDGKTRIVDYKLNDPEAGDPGVCGGQMEVYVEPILPPKTVVVIGAGHVGQAVAHLAKWLGYQVLVSDDRPDFVLPELVPEADRCITGSIHDLLSEFQVHQQTFFVLTTRGVEVDSVIIPEILKTPAAYIGAIGSRRRWETTRKALQEAGVSKEKIASIHSPVGIEIWAETPAEIAVSIMAEITMLARGGKDANKK